MAVDWFTLIAQIVNFLILVWLLKRLFYTQIIGAMDARAAGIAGRLKEAAHEREEAKTEAEAYRARNREFEQQRERMLERAAEEAEAQRQTLLEDVHRQTDNARKQWLSTVERERQELLQDFRERVGEGVFRLANQSLRELADTDLETQMLKMFTQRVLALDPERRKVIVAAIRDSGGEVEVRTAFALDAQAREHLSSELRRHLDDGLTVRFSTVPELICGIELRTNGHSLAWNLDSHLENLEARVFELMDEDSRNHAADR